MNDFGEMSETGVVLSNNQMRERRLKRGECVTCGMKCFKKTLFKSTPITEDGKVLNGRCLICRPLDATEIQTASIPVTAQVEIASSKDLHRANKSIGSNSSFKSIGSNSSFNNGRAPPNRDLNRKAVSDGDVLNANTKNRAPAQSRHGHRSSSMISMQTVQEQSQGVQPENQGRRVCRRASLKSSSIRSSSSTDQGDDRGSALRRSSIRASSLSLDYTYPTPNQGDEPKPTLRRSSIRASSLNLDQIEPEQADERGAALRSSSQRASALNVHRPKAEEVDQNGATRRSSFKRSSPPNLDPPTSEKPSDTVHKNAIAVAASLHLQRNFREKKAQKKNQSSIDSSTHSQSDKSLEEIKAKNTESSRSIGSSRSNISSKDVKPKELDETQAIRILEHPNCTFSKLVEIVVDFANVDSVEKTALMVLDERTMKVLAEPEAEMLLERNDAGVRFILRKLKSDSIEVAEKAFSVLYSISAVRVLKEAIVNNGGVESILGSIERFKSNVEMDNLWLRCIYRLSTVSESYFYMLCEGVDKHIIGAMERNSENIDVQKCCCDIIIKLAKEDSSLRNGIVEANGAGQIAITMIMYSDDFDLLDKALRALRNLCHESDNNKRSITDSGVVDSIVSTMQKHRDNAAIQASAARTLGEIGSTTETALTVGNCGGIDVITRAIYVHESRKSVIKKCCAALESLSFPRDNRTLMVEIGVINALIYTMQTHPEDIGVQTHCYNVLSTLAEGSGKTEVIKKKIIDQEALDFISMSMVMHGSDEKLQVAACSLLSNLVCHVNYEALLAGGAPELMKAASEKFSACRESMDYMMMMLDRIESQ